MLTCAMVSPRQCCLIVPVRELRWPRGPEKRTWKASTIGWGVRVETAEGINWSILQLRLIIHHPTCSACVSVKGAVSLCMHVSFCFGVVWCSGYIDVEGIRITGTWRQALPLRLYLALSAQCTKDSSERCAPMDEEATCAGPPGGRRKAPQAAQCVSRDAESQT